MPRRIKNVAKRAFKLNSRDIETQLPDFISKEPTRRRERSSSDDVIRYSRVEILPRNLSQERYIDALTNEHNTIVFAMGPAGTGKTMLATQYAIKELQCGNIDRIIITRPAVSNGEELGALPGTMIEKMAPWTRPLIDVFREYYSVKTITKMLEEEILEICPLGFMRGRAQPYDSMVMTPHGEKRMGDISVGEYVLGSNGKPTKVTGVFPQGKKKIYKISFSDKTSTLASGDHLWLTESRNEYKHKKGFSVKTTDEIASKVKCAHNNNHKVPILSNPAEFQFDANLFIDPYFLGLLLGDGNLHENASISFTTVDTEMVDYISNILPDSMKIEKCLNSEIQYRICGIARHNKPNVIKEHLRTLNMTGKKSYEKFIPKEYLLSSQNNRLELLKGLLDTDGTVFFNRTKTRIQYSSTSEQLTKDVAFIVRSLGGIANIRERNHENDKRNDEKQIFHRRNSFVIEIKMPQNLNPFKLERKHDLFDTDMYMEKYISSVDYVDEIECQCISVDAKDSLYLTDDFIVTHNTFKNSIVIFDEAQNSLVGQMKMCLTRIGDNTRMFVTGDLRQHDRGFEENGLRDFINRIDRQQIPGISVCRFNPGDVERHPIIEQVLDIYGEDD